MLDERARPFGPSFALGDREIGGGTAARDGEDILLVGFQVGSEDEGSITGAHSRRQPNVETCPRHVTIQTQK